MPVLDWRLDQAPYWLETPPAGESLLLWAQAGPDGASRLSRLALAQRLDLMLQAADAVAAAHDVGVLHGDLKPANLLLEAAADAPAGWRLRLADFGAGRVLDAQRLEALRITQMGLTVGTLQAAGGATPLYLAPEVLTGVTPGARADVYALGVLLYQVLCGDLVRPLAPGWERDIDDELLREDIARATDGDPAHRLASAAELAQRLRRLPQRRRQRADEAAAAEQAVLVQLRWQRLRARRPWVWAAGLALSAGLAASTASYLDQRRAARALAEQYALSQALNELLREDLIGAANPARSGRADVTVAEALRGAAGHIDQRFAASPPVVRAQLHAAMQSALSELSRAQEAAEAGQRAVAVAESSGAVPRDEVQAWRLRLALDLAQLSRVDEARALLRRVDADAGAAASQAPEFRARLLYVQSWLAAGPSALRDATALLEQAMALVQGRSEAEAPWREKIIFGLADNLVMAERAAEGEVLYRRLIDELSAGYGAGHARTQYARVGLGSALAAQGRLDAARAVLVQAAEGLEATLGPAHRMALSARDQLAAVRLRSGDAAGAAQEWRPVLDGFGQLLGEASSYTLSVRTNLGIALQRSGRAAEAEPLLREGWRLGQAGLPADAPQLQLLRYALADCLVALRHAGAVGLLQGLSPEVLQQAQPEPDWPARLSALRARALGRSS